jgi:hypothetical protein
MKTTHGSRALLVLVPLALAFCAGRARATPNFPPAIQAELGASKEPDCSICHVGGKTGLGTVNTKFGTAMRDRGLVANSETSLKAAHAKMRTDKVDSNGDGELDVDALKAGKDPNASSGPGAGADDVPKYGCGASIAGRETRTGDLAVAAALALGLAFAGRRSRRR